MNDVITGALGFVLAALLGGGLWLLERQRAGARQKAESARADQALSQFQREAEVHAREQLSEAKSRLETETQSQRRGLQELEKRLGSAEVDLERRAGRLEAREVDADRRETDIARREGLLGGAERQLDDARREVSSRLEQLSGTTREEARGALIEEITAEARLEAARRIRAIDEDAKAETDRRAKKAVALAIERLAGDWVAERTVSVVALPADELKGRLIGRSSG